MYKFKSSFYLKTINQKCFMKKSFLFLVLLAVVSLTSCQKEELENSSNSVSKVESSDTHLKSAKTEIEPNDTPSSARVTVYAGDTFSGTIESYGSNDFFRFSHSGGAVAFTLTGSITYQNLGLVDSNNNYIGQGWTIVPGQYLVFTDLPYGTYYLRVSGYGGTYTVSINPPISDAEPLYFKILKDTPVVNGDPLSYQYVIASNNTWGGVEEYIYTYLPVNCIACLTSYYPWYNEVVNQNYHIYQYSTASNGYPIFARGLNTGTVP